MVYITDGSFEGLLTAVFEAYQNRENPEDIISRSTLQLSMVIEMREIITDPEKSDRVYKAISEKISQEALEMVYSAYLSEAPDCGLYIYRFIRIGMKIGKKVCHYLQNPDVLRVHDLSRKVFGATHRFLGLLRFKRIQNGIFYAQYEPDHNITMLISGHFAERLSDQPWIIHDTGRDVCALYDTREYVLMQGHPPFIDEAQPEEEFERLWKGYFKAIAIESRKNPRLQRSFMPVRYWKNLTEKRL